MALPSISVTTHHNSEGIVQLNDEHIHRRVFIGPMPEKVVSQTEAKALKHKKRGLFRISTPQEEDDMNVIKEAAFKFFVHTGGQPKDWGEDQEQSITHELLQQWRNSEWGVVWGRRRKKESGAGPKSSWVGGSFEIGHFLGVNVLQEFENGTSSLSTGKASTSKCQPHTKPEREPFPSTTQNTFETTNSELLHSAPGGQPTGPGPSSFARETFISAPSDFLPPASLDIDNGTPYINGAVSVESSVRDTSSTALLDPSLGRVHFDGLGGARVLSEVVPRPIIRVPSLPVSTDGQAQGYGKGKGRLVHYDIPVQEASGPIPPSEVLERTGDAVEGTSAGATTSGSESSKTASLDWGDVVMRGTGIDIPFVFRRIDPEERQDANAVLLQQIRVYHTGI